MFAWLLLLACDDPVSPYTPLPHDSDTATTAATGLLESTWCDPNPCDDRDRGVCRVQEAAVVCLCDEGFLETVDGVCEPQVCLPNPCDVAGGTACSAVDAESATCGCEAGLQRDSWGRCVTDAEQCADPASNPSLVVETDGYAVHLAPVVGSDGTAYVPQLGRGVVAIAPDGSARWSPRYDYSAGSPLALGSQGEIFTGDADGVLHVVHPDDGREWWSWTVGGAIVSPAAAASDGTVYVGDASGVLTSLLAAQQVWLREFRNATDVRPAVGPGDEAYAVAVVSDAGTWDSTLYRLDPVDGDIEWKFDDAGLALLAGSPAVTSDGLVLLAADSVLVAITDTGELAWSVDLPAPAASTPVPDGAGGVYLIAGTSLCRVESEAVAWCLDSVTALTAPALAQQRHAAFGGESSSLHLVSPTGDRVWTMTLEGALTAPSQGPDGHLRLGSNAGVLYTVTFCGACEQTWCDGEVLMGCREDGLGMQSLEDCTDAGATCSAGACRVDPYSAQAWRTCGDDGPVWVDSDGATGESIETCDDGEHCLQGACVSCWASQAVGCSDDLTVAVLDECGNLESVVEYCNAASEGCVEGRCVTCTPQAGTVCEGGQPHYVDACGNLEDPADSCSDTETCEDGACVACGSRAETVCQGDDAWWADACGNLEELADDCGYYDECVDGVCVEDCEFLTCTTASFLYTCSSGIDSFSCTYDGPGPNGLSECVTAYDNGHSVTCAWTSETEGSCVDDGGLSCGF